MIEGDKNLLANYTFIDLFAGIGGFHYALNSFGAKCIFASEWDLSAAQTYTQNHGLKPFGDIAKIEVTEIPQHDILCAGFPCQAFSISGKQRGFEDTRGTSFFEVARIINHHKPKIVFLENVKNLIKHDKGQTLKTILQTLAKLGYNTKYQIMNSADFGLPQNRERVYFVAFRQNIDSTKFCFPKPLNEPVSLLNILEEYPHDAKVIVRNDVEIYRNVIPQKTIFDEVKLFNRPFQIGKINKGGQGERIYHPLGYAITLSAHGGGVGAKTGLYLVDGKIRKLSPRECARLQGFPESFVINPSTTQAYKQFGNSVSINVLQYIIKEFGKVLKENG